jgi:serine/threonine protein kinase
MQFESNTDFAHFHILRKLGLEGDVFKAYDKQNQRFVAIRLLAPRPHLKEDLEKLQTSPLFDHPSLMKICEIGYYREFSYLATEISTGLTLKERMTQKHFPFFFVVELLRQLTEHLQFCLEKGFSRGELRPANIYLGSSSSYDLQVQFALVGLNSDASEESHISGSTEFGAMMRYIAPEVIQQGVAQENSVVFSLGMMAYELLSDQDPFQGKNSSSHMYAILNKDLPPLQTSEKAYNAPVNQLLQEMLQKDPKKRISLTEVSTFIQKEFLKGKTLCVKLLPQIFLEIREHENIRKYPLKRGLTTPVTLGRSEKNTIRLDNVKASRHHAEVHCVYQDDFIVKDSNSRNGIRVNGLKVNQTLLKNGDEIDISKLSKIHFIRFFEEFSFFKGDLKGEAEFQKILTDLDKEPVETQSLKSSRSSSLDPDLVRTITIKSVDEQANLTFQSQENPARIESQWGNLAETLQIIDSNTLRNTLSTLLQNLVISTSSDRALLISTTEQILQCEIARNKSKTEVRLDELFSVKEDLIHQVLKTGLPVLSSLYPSAPPLSLLIFPIMVRQKNPAVLYLDTIQSQRGLSEDEMAQAEFMASYMSNYVEKLTLESQLNEAKKEIVKLQGPKETFLLPEEQLTWYAATLPTHRTLEIDGERLIYETEERTFYDFIYHSDEDPVFFFTGRQEDSLVYPGVLRLVFRTILHSMADFPSLSTPIQCLHEALYKELGSTHQISLLLLKWDPLNSAIHYVACGKQYFAVLRANEQKFKIYQVDGPFLGKTHSNLPFKQETLHFQKNDMILWFNPSLLQVSNAQGQTFGLERLQSLLNKNADQNPRSLKGELLNAIIEHFDEHTPSSDIVVGTLKHK